MRDRETSSSNDFGPDPLTVRPSVRTVVTVGATGTGGGTLGSDVWGVSVSTPFGAGRGVKRRSFSVDGYVGWESLSGGPQGSPGVIYFERKNTMSRDTYVDP